MKLGKIASLKSGLVLTRKRASIKYEVEETYQVVTLRNLDDSGFFNNGEYDSFESNEVLDQDYFTEEGDILVRLSEPHTAVYVDRSRAGLLVPSSLVIIKVRSADFLPRYITWYLNSEYAKKELIRYQAGTAALTTTSRVLSQIDVKRIPLEEQRIIGEIHKLHFKETRLLTKLIEEKQNYFRGITTKLMNREGVVIND